MIGNAIPYLDSGFSILEEGSINPSNYSFEVQRYLMVDPQGHRLGSAPSLEQAKAELERHLAKPIVSQYP